MNNKMSITKKDILWNGLGSILTLAMNVLLLPVLLKILPSHDIGLWYVFTSISSLITILDFGFSPTISRNVTCAWCGVAELQKEGLPSVPLDRETNYLLLKSLLGISRTIYFWISIISSIILLTFGTWYIYSLVNEYDNDFYYIAAWTIYALSIVINMYYSYWNAFLRGIGALEKLNRATIISRVVFILLSLVGLILNGGLIAIAIAQIISGILLRQLCKKEFVKIVGIEFQSIKVLKTYNKSIFHQLLPNTTRYGIVSIGSFLIQRADTLLCSTFLGLEVTSSYGLTMQLFSILGSISQLLFSSYSPQITAERINKNNDKLKSILSISVVFQFLVGTLGALAISFIGPWGLKILHANSSLLSTNLILILSVVMIFEWNTSVFVNFIMTSNNVPFAKSSIVTGILMTILSYLLLSFTGIGVLSLILGRAIISFSYINWYWPKYVCRELKTKFYQIIKLGLYELYNRASAYIKIQI